MIFRLLPHPFCLVAIFLTVSYLYGQSVAIIGGTDGTGAPYAAFINLNPNPTLLTNLPVSGTIRGIATNHFGQAIIGGTDGTGMYGAFVAPNSFVAGPPITNLLGTGLIQGVAINDLNETLVAGRPVPNQMYAAFIDINTNAAGPLIIGLPPDVGGTQLYGAAINNAATSLVAGIDLNAPYAAFIDKTTNTVTTTISNLPPPGFDLESSAINQNGLSLIGGRNVVTQAAYAAFIPSGSSVASSPISSLPEGGPYTYIKPVALNDSGIGLVGGRDASNAAYAAFVSVGANQATSITNLPTAYGSNIQGAAINQYGQGLIGGTDGTKAYVALVDPLTNRASNPLPNLPSHSGSAISAVAFFRLPAIPTSGLTGNNLSFANYINANAPQDAFYFIPALLEGALSQALEKAAPTRNAISLFMADNNLLFLNHGLSVHLRNYRHFRDRGRVSYQDMTAKAANPSSHYIASLDQNVFSFPERDIPALQGAKEAWWARPAAKDEPLPDEPAEICTAAPNPCRKDPLWNLWFEAIGAFIHQDKQKQTPSFTPSVGGAIVAVDKKVEDDFAVGGGVGYTFTHIKEGEETGHSHINQEYLLLYGTWLGSQMYVDAALWAGFFQIHQVRDIGFSGFIFQSISNPYGYQISPHAEFGYDHLWTFCNHPGLELVLDPFAMIDWVNAWQPHYEETGVSPFNAGQKNHYSSLLRGEVGLRLYETVFLPSWNFTFEEKVSYVNRTPFQVGRVNAFLVGSPGGFIVETLTASENLAAIELMFIAEPANHAYPYGSISYQGEFSPSYQSHQVSAEISWNF